MTRRAIKRGLRKAEYELRSGNRAEALAIYDAMLRAFDDEVPVLLDHAAVIWGKTQALNALGRHEEATRLAESAVFALSVHTMLEAVAA